MSGIVYTNTSEGFWPLLKRGIIGIYHFTTRKLLQKSIWMNLFLDIILVIILQEIDLILFFVIWKID